MAFVIDGNIALKTREFLRCSDDRAADMLGWNGILGLQTYLAGAVPSEFHKTEENKMLRVLIILLFIGQVAQAEEATENLATDRIQQDEFGCMIVERPDGLTFLTFRDAWRSIAADKLYSLRRHEAAIAAESCDCAALRPEWDTIIDEFDALGFAASPSSAYRDWAAASYFPIISDLRKSVQELCEVPR